MTDGSTGALILFRLTCDVLRERYPSVPEDAIEAGALLLGSPATMGGEWHVHTLLARCQAAAELPDTERGKEEAG